MTERQFPILGTEEIPMLGRAELMDRIWGDISKTTPSNLSIVGPRYIGKTVLLKAVAERAKADDSPFALVLYWEVGFQPPQSDEAFLADLCDQIFETLAVDSVKYQEHRSELADDKAFSTLKEVMDLLEMDGETILMIWDGFDKPLSQGQLSGTLFGQLRDLFNGKSHKIITAARAKQSELAADKQVEDSPFWNMFDVNPVRVGPLDDDDCKAVFYLDWLMDNKAEFELLVLRKFGESVVETIEWSAPRLICIAGDFTKYDQHAVQQINRNIELILKDGFTRDVRGIGHFGTGDLEIAIGSMDALEQAKPLLLRSYEAS